MLTSCRSRALSALVGLCLVVSSLAVRPSLAISQEPAPSEYDVVVIGGTPGGIASAITAARLGRTVALVEYHPHLGGMTTSGLGKTDVETPEAIGGLFREFIDRVKAYYAEKYGADSENVKLCRDGYYFEPSVAEAVLERMIAAEPKITVLKNHRFEDALRQNRRVVGSRVTDRATGADKHLRGKQFIDATYEGDLAASAGVEYRLGREGREEFSELHAGVIYQNHETRAFLPGSTGKGDPRLQAYTYRLCLTTDPANSVRITSPPADYDRTKYLGYLDDWKSGRFDAPKNIVPNAGFYAPTFGTVVRALSIADIPNRKVDVNMNPRALGFPFTEENYDYPEADWAKRERISKTIRNLTLGLLYFLQNDEEIPAEHRALANKFHLPKDEFTDSGHFPFQLYVREARRIKGKYTLSEHDVTVGPKLGRPPTHWDAVAAGEYPIDSFPVRKREPGHDQVLEGYIFMQKELTRPYQIPYRILMPEYVDNLLVPVAASTTHVAFSSIRLEPTWMALGQAAAAAAHLAIHDRSTPDRIHPPQLQRLLLEQGQVLTYFRDLDRSSPHFAALQYFGAKGWFPDYDAAADRVLTQGEATMWLNLRGPSSVWKIPDDTPLTHREAKQRLASLKLNLPDDDKPLTRGEFCQALYDAGY